MECITKLIHNEKVMTTKVGLGRFGFETSGEDGSMGAGKDKERIHVFKLDSE